MIPWVLVDTAMLPDGRTELRLKRRGREFSIMIGQNELMGSRLSGSEEALARIGAERVAGRRAPQVLIGGLGMGFTLRAAQALLSASARITVAELLPAVVDWARGPMAELFGDSLADPRLEIRVGDVGGLIADGHAAYDAILLDVDNGPEGLTASANDGLYSDAGIARSKAALRPGGTFAVWSASPDPGFARRLRHAGLAVEEVRARAGRRGGARHVIFVATRPA